MAVKSIIDIDVDDAKFQAFTKKFNAYRDAVKKLPGAWKESEKASESMADHFATMTAAMMAQNDLQKQSLVHQRAAGSHMRGMVRDSAAIARNIGGVTLNLLKWVGIGGLLGGAGLFGIGSLAGTVGGQRRSALGLGISTGQQAAFGVSYNRFVDTNATLGNIADAKSDYSKRWAFSAMGVNPEGKNPAALGVEMMVKAKEIFDKSGGSAQEAKAHGLLEIFSMEDLRRLHNTSMKELREREGNFRGTVGKLSRQDEINKKWQDFSDRLRDSGYSIQNLIVDKLGGKVVPALDKLSRATVGVLEKFLDNKDFSRALDNVGRGIEKFALYVGTPEFQTNVKQFASDVVALAGAVHNGLVKLGLATDQADPLGGQIKRVTPGTISAVKGGPMGAAYNTLLKWGGPSGHGWSKQGAAGLVANFQAESGMNPFAKGDGGQAYGLSQWHPDRRENYTKLFGHSMESVKDRDQAMREQMGFANWELTKGAYAKYGQKANEASSGYIAGYGLSKGYERPRDMLGFKADDRGRQADVIVTIMNNTGGNASATVAQVAQ